MPEKPPAAPRRRPTAAGSWVRSLQCKSMAVEDVAARGAVGPRKLHPLLPRSGCASTGDARKNVTPSKKPKPMSSSDVSKKKSGSSNMPSPKPVKKTKKPTSVPPSPPPGPLGPLPALRELPAGHSSRQVVEIIFLSSWSPFPLPQPPPPPPLPGASTATGGAFPGEVEMLFRVHNPARAVARFEDYRAAVRARAGGATRSAADGNEMMRFSPAPAYGSVSASYAAGEDALRVRTFDGSGGAHASARGPASGRRAMFLCRVIAGRVAEAGTGSGSELDAAPGKEHDSLRVGKDELVVFDQRAVLPCFLIIYKL